MPAFNLDNYEPVEERLARFWEDNPQGAIRTDRDPVDSGEWVIKAAVFRDRSHPLPDATGYAHEVVGQGSVNRTSALENCETSAIGRALANLGYAPSGARPSREEMEKVSSAPAQAKKPTEKATQDATTAFLNRARDTISGFGMKFKDIPDLKIRPEADTAEVKQAVLGWYTSFGKSEDEAIDRLAALAQEAKNA